VIDDRKRLPQAGHTVEVKSQRAGFLTAIECEQMGTACVILGGGRERKEDAVDPAVGIVLHKKVGDPVRTGESLATIHYNSESKAERARRLIAQSCTIGEAAPAQRPLVHRVIAHAGDQH
jgi:pyrimidine-nucleoside phosphorylase